MNTVIVFAAVMAVAIARPGGDLVSVEQDNLGNYKYSVHGIHGSSKVESRKIPSYAYIEPYPVARKVVPLAIEATPTFAIAKTEALPILRNVEFVQTPLIKEFEIPHVPLVKSSLVETVHPSLLRVAAIPETTVLELEAKPISGHVALENHHFISKW